jgi:hypothetical protein
MNLENLYSLHEILAGGASLYETVEDSGWDLEAAIMVSTLER